MTTMEAVREMFLGNRVTCDGGRSHYYLRDRQIYYRLSCLEVECPSTDIYRSTFWNNRVWEFYKKPQPKTEIELLREEVAQLKADLRKAGQLS